MSQFPNPSTQFKPGQSGNPGGKTSSHRQSEIEAAELAAKVQLRMMKAVDEKITQLETALDTPDPYAALLVIKADVLKLIKDAQDRGYGAPVQVLDNTSSDGTMTPKSIVGDAVLDAIRAKHGVKS
jgi:hypothetical protein